MKTKFYINSSLSLLFILASFYSNFVSGQDTASINIYFDTDKYNLSANALDRIDALIASFPINQIAKVQLLGHTDSRSNEVYNQILSENRVQTTKTALIDLGIDEKKIHTVGWGERKPLESNETGFGRQQNRRVEIAVYRKKTIHIATVPKQKDTIDKPKPPLLDDLVEKAMDCSKDTTLTMPNGSLVTFGICDYYAHKDCFKFTEFIHPDSARAAGLSTMAADGTPLISVGMFKVELCKNPANSSKRYEDPPCIIAHIPLRTSSINKGCNAPVRGITKWFQRPDGSWVDSAESMELVEINGQLYYKTEVCGAGIYNGDRKGSGNGDRYYLTRVKVAKGLHLLDAKISFDAPFSILGSIKKGSKRMVKIPVPEEMLCNSCSDAIVYAKALDKNGDTLILNYTIADPYHRRTAFGQCRGKVVKKFLFFFKIREKNIYRKYFLRRKDFKVCLFYQKKEDEHLSQID
ncbi:OmpA family protein [Aureispira anguillae]|uniref:OmpA family protein n=1 Tax=Aureispira anguillae TaxID=2864201 RepID=A0A915YMP8_9BACT|nr:OmpA family protein [Aureispira anguillae]BDS15648.1 OmpA family protein [Aureispira anguillae]